MKKINWFSIIITAIITGAVTVGAGLVLSKLEKKEPILQYSIIETAPFSGNNQFVGVYHVTISNDGEKEVEKVLSTIAIPGAKIDNKNVLAKPTITFSDKMLGDTFSIDIPLLNPAENVQISILASSQKKLPKFPDVSLRAKGLSGIEKPLKTPDKRFSLSNIFPAIAGALAGIMFYLFRIVYKEKEDEDTEHLSYGNPNHAIAYLCSIYGLKDECVRLYELNQSTSFYGESDRLTFYALDSNDPNKIDAVKNILLQLSNDKTINQKSLAVINYNISSIYAFEKDAESSKRYLEESLKLSKSFISHRISIDPLLNNLVGDTPNKANSADANSRAAD